MSPLDTAKGILHCESMRALIGLDFRTIARQSPSNFKFVASHLKLSGSGQWSAQPVQSYLLLKFNGIGFVVRPPINPGSSIFMPPRHTAHLQRGKKTTSHQPISWIDGLGWSLTLK